MNKVRIGGIRGIVATKSANFTVDAQTDIFACSGTITATLKPISGYKGRRMFYIANTGTGVVTVSANGSETINGFSTSIQLDPQEAKMFLAVDNSSWKTLSPEVHVLEYIPATTGNVTSNQTALPIGVARKSGTILDVVLTTYVNGADSADPLNITADVKKKRAGTTVSVCSTNPKLDKTAGAAHATTAAAGTGITQAVLKTDGSEDVQAGDYLVCDLTLTRTTPDTEIAGPVVTVYILYH